MVLSRSGLGTLAYLRAQVSVSMNIFVVTGDLAFVPADRFRWHQIQGDMHLDLPTKKS